MPKAQDDDFSFRLRGNLFTGLLTRISVFFVSSFCSVRFPFLGLQLDWPRTRKNEYRVHPFPGLRRQGIFPKAKQSPFHQPSTRLSFVVQPGGERYQCFTRFTVGDRGRLSWAKSRLGN